MSAIGFGFMMKGRRSRRTRWYFFESQLESLETAPKIQTAICYPEPRFHPMVSGVHYRNRGNTTMETPDPTPERRGSLEARAAWRAL